MGSFPNLALHPYAARSYAAPLAPLRDPVWVEPWGCHVVARPIPGGPHEDAAGPYPLCPMRKDADLAAGLGVLRARGFVSVVLISDPFFAPSPLALGKAFSVFREFKRHHVVDYGSPTIQYSAHHTREVKRAASRCDVREVRLMDTLSVWIRLYDVLVQRHGIAGPQTFSLAYFESLASDARFVVTAAYLNEIVASMHIWVRHQEVVYSHLAASDTAGYRVGASYSLYDDAIRRFQSAHCLDLGGTAGATDKTEDGLGRFKAGFANATAQTYLCGAVLDRGTYDTLCADLRCQASDDYFPTYRSPQLTRVS